MQLNFYLSPEKLTIIVMATLDKKQKTSLPVLNTGSTNMSTYYEDCSQKEAPAEFMQRSNVDSLVNNALLALLQARPREPIAFLSDYFGAYLEPRNRLLSAQEKIMTNHYTSSVFENNLVEAFKVLRLGKGGNIGQKPSAFVGVRGEEHNDLLMMLTRDMPIKYAEPLLNVLIKPDKQSVSFSSFRNDVTTIFLYQEFIRVSLSIYQDIDFSGKGHASRELCNVFLKEFKSLLDNGNSHEKFREDFNRVIARHSTFDTQEKNSMNVDEFVQSALGVFLRDSETN